jgi:hypothetical protein
VTQILGDAASDIRQPALDRLISRMLANGTNSQKVLSMVTFDSKYTRALTFENLCHQSRRYPRCGKFPPLCSSLRQLSLSQGRMKAETAAVEAAAAAVAGMKS